MDWWFQSPYQEINQSGQHLVDDAMDMVRRDTYRKAQAVSRQLASVSPALQPALAKHLVGLGDVDTLELIDRSGKVLYRSMDTLQAPDSYKLDKSFSREGLRGWVGLSPRPMVESGVRVNDQVAVMVGSYLPKDLFQQMDFIAKNNRQFLLARSQRKVVKISLISSFLALTLMITFVALWIGSHLAREISIPLQLLLEGTREVSKGNLAHQIPYEAKDEIGQVVKSFNRMTQDLQASKRELEWSNQELRMSTQSAELRRRYIETLLETLNIGVISTDTEGDVRTLNLKARELMGVERGERLQNIISRPEWAPIREILSGLPERPVMNREIPLPGGRGQRILSVSAATLKDPSGTPFGYLLILEDITDLSRAQRIAAWQEVAQRMAHEIKNPLTPIRLSSQRIRKKVKEKAQDLETAVMEGTNTIEREVEGMMTMVNEFSRFARLPEIHPKPVSLTSLLMDAASTYRSAYAKVNVEMELPPDFPPVRLDWEPMHRVFKNLFENAIEAMEMSGTISISLRRGDGHAVITMRDTGPGIPREARSRLFMPYYSTKRKGTGLGLPIVARVLEEHGGTIEVDESYEGGAGFIITLPL
ncbi:MAG: ATP-binding protein [Acidobacteriota bacterium]